MIISRPLRAGSIAVALLLIAPAAFAQAALDIKDGDTLTGVLRLDRTHHPNGMLIKAYQIVSAPRKMPDNDDFCSYDGPGATTFHLFTTTHAAVGQLQPLLGKTVTVKADELFCSQTAWHIGDVAVPKWTLIKGK